MMILQYSMFNIKILNSGLLKALLLTSFFSSSFLEPLKMERKLMEEERSAKEEEVDRLSRDSDEKQMVVQVLKNELDCMNNLKRFDEDQHHHSSLHHKTQKKDTIDMEHKERITKLEGQLQDAYNKMQEIENKSAKTMSSLQEKDSKVQQHLSQQARECKVFLETSTQIREMSLAITAVTLTNLDFSNLYSN